MTDTELPFPAETMTPDDAPAPAPVAAAPRQNVATVDLMSLALSRFGQWRAGAAALVEKYRGVVFDCTTPKGYEQAKKALADVRQPRYAAQNVSKASKSELAAVSKAIGAEEQAVITYLADTETLIRAQIDVEDERRAQAKAEAERIEAERVARHRRAIEAIEAYVGHASGLPSARIEGGLIALRALDDGFRVEAWDEFADQARATIAATITSLTTMMAAAKRSEDAAVEAERLRAENARQAAELAELRAEREAAARRDQEAQRLADKQRREAEAEACAAAERAKAQAAHDAPAPACPPVAPCGFDDIPPPPPMKQRLLAGHAQQMLAVLQAWQQADASADPQDVVAARARRDSLLYLITSHCSGTFRAERG